MYNEEFFKPYEINIIPEEHRITPFAKRLRELRSTTKKLSQEKVSKELGFSKATYGTYENSKFLPDAKTVAKLADYFGVSADYLLGLTDDSQGTSVSEIKLSKNSTNKIKDISQTPDMFKTMDRFVGSKKFKEFVELMDKYLIFSSVVSRFELECLDNKEDYIKIKKAEVYDNIYCDEEAVLRDVKVSAIYQSLLEECFRNILADMSRDHIYEDRLIDLIHRIKKEN